MNVYTRHIISACLSFTIYFFIIFLVFFKMETSTKVIDYSEFSKNSVDIFQDFKVNDSFQLDSIVKNSDLPKQIQSKDEKIALPTPPKKTSLNDMFSSIPTPSQDNLKKEIEEKHKKEELIRKEKAKQLEQIKELSTSATKLQENLENLKQAAKNASSVVSSLNEIEIVKPSVDNTKDNGEYNEWYKEVSKIIAGWKKESTYYKNAVIVVRVSIDGAGRFNLMYVVKSSEFPDYDSIALSFLQKLKGIAFPVPPSGARQEFNVSFTSRVNK